MGLNNFLLPERLPRQFIYAGDRHCEIFTLAGKRIVRRQRVAGVALAELAAGGWPEIGVQLQPVDTGLILNSDPFIYNFFEFDQLPWSRKLLRELVAWKLQKIFPENIEAYDHQFFRLNKKRIFSILVKKALLAADRIPVPGKAHSPDLHRQFHAGDLEPAGKTQAPARFFRGNRRLAAARLVFQNKGLPIYIRKFKSGSRGNWRRKSARPCNSSRTTMAATRAAITSAITGRKPPADGIAAELAREEPLLPERRLAWANAVYSGQPMRKINYNLAGARKIDARAFALIVAVIFLAAVLFNAVTIFNLASQQRQSRAEKDEIRFAALKLEELQQKTLLRQREIVAWKKAWEQKLAFANFLIERKSLFIHLPPELPGRSLQRRHARPPAQHGQ